MTPSKFKVAAAWSLSIAAILLTFGFLSESLAQPAISGRIRNFQTFANDRQGKRTVLRGKDARNISRDIAEIIGPRLESVNESNQVTLTIEAPQCLYNNQTQIATSAETISLKMSGGKFSITGRGWTWLASESRLIISNDVVAIIAKEALQTNRLSAIRPGSTNKAGGEVRISSTGFDFQTDTIVFHERVVVLDEQGTLGCRTLRAKLAQPGNQLERIEAEDEVRIAQNDTVATGGRAVYLVRQDEITMTNSPAWKMGDKEGHSDLLVLSRAKNHLRTAGHVYMKLPISGLATNGLAAAGNDRSTNIVEITAETFDYDQKTAIYRGSVHAKEAQGTIDSEILTIYFLPEGNRPDKIVAETNVTMVRGESRVQGNKATYEIAADRLRVEGEPKWEIGDKRGESGYLVLRPKTQEFQAGEGVRMIVNTVPGMSFVIDAAPERGSELKASGHQAMQISAEQLDHKDNLTIFEKAVQIKDSRGEIRCEFLVIATGQSNQVTHIAADQHVVITQTNMTATSDRAIYTLTNGIIKLTGSPKLKTPDHLLTADVFLLNRSNNTFRTQGKYRIEMTRPPDPHRTNSMRAKL